jgi:hypothetical protein
MRNSKFIRLALGVMISVIVPFSSALPALADAGAGATVDAAGVSASGSFVTEPSTGNTLIVDFHCEALAPGAVSVFFSPDDGCIAYQGTTVIGRANGTGIGPAHAVVGRGVATIGSGLISVCVLARALYEDGSIKTSNGNSGNPACFTPQLQY